jgi:hypothetical protein
MKGRALRRALETSDVHRISGDVPLIVDTTELITPEVAYEMLLKNKNNRPINWQRVEEYAAIMAAGGWELHAQGIILDNDGNLLTGQKRLWAVIYSGMSVYMRVSRGNPPRVARLLDRGTPQSARDLASRGTGKKHSPVEASVGRAVLALRGNTRPSADELADQIERSSSLVEGLLNATRGTRKRRAVLMILAAISAVAGDETLALAAAKRVDGFADDLERVLLPQSADACWGRGAAFTLAMDHARRIIEGGAS